MLSLLFQTMKKTKFCKTVSKQHSHILYVTVLFENLFFLHIRLIFIMFIFFIQKSEFVNTTVISVAYTRDSSLLERNLPTLQVSRLPDNNTTDINNLLQETFVNLTHYSQINQTDGNEESHEERLQINLTNKEKETVFLTGLGVESLWETPFH